MSKKIIGNAVGTTLNPAMLGGGGNGEGPAIVVSASKPFAKNCVWFNTSKVPPTTDNTTINITDDGNGNVTITASGNTYIVDDGEGNVIINTPDAVSIVDDGKGNVIIT